MFFNPDENRAMHGNDFYFSCGLNALLDYEIQNVKREGYHPAKVDFTVWILTELNLTGIVPLIEQRTSLPHLILCDTKYLRLFKSLSFFKDVEILDAKAPLSEIQSVIARLLRSERMDEPAVSGDTMTGNGYSGIFPSEKTVRKNAVLKLLIQGFSPEQCALLMNLSIKTISGYKRNLMRDLQLHSNQDLLIAMKLMQHFAA